ncbi:MAG: vitamin K epoxide reductase family protein [Chloroflexi bacterium]|nr:vitamin K epoxide reductase family protein [Chloroflexota bacterium]
MSGLRHPLTIASLILAVVGFGLSAYLTYVHYNIDALVCSTGGCELVQTSEYSEMFGIPIAIFGMIMFTVIIAGTIIREVLPEYGDLISTGILMILLTAVIYWAYLTWLELNVIHAVCQWCVATSIATLLLLAVEAFRWYRNYKELGTT